MALKVAKKKNRKKSPEMLFVKGRPDDMTPGVGPANL